MPGKLAIELLSIIIELLPAATYVYLYCINNILMLEQSNMQKIAHALVHMYSVRC